MFDSHQSRLRHLVLECCKAKGGIEMTFVSLEATSSPVFMKRRFIPLGLREPVHKVLEEILRKEVLITSRVAAENFVLTLKSAIASVNPSTFDELDIGVDSFLIQYRNAVHSTAGRKPAKLFKSRAVLTNLLRLESAEVAYHRGIDLRPFRDVLLNQIGQRAN
ncbi:unnamed protein product [Echinostoma caproni]|uniref:NPH3 domain-containing protein n=1 Tax=Echinostoma caproni TaxID=27848 RepID=A0A183B4L7_9TREM|nr:unnamed protein product [Echinostoma caproni]